MNQRERLTDRDYVDSKIESTRDFLLARIESLKSTFDQWQEFRDRFIAGLQADVASVEKRFDEKLRAIDISHEKDQQLVEERMDRFSQFRDQITAERGLYITRDFLDVTVKGMYTDIDLAKRAAISSAGRDAGVSNTWKYIAVAFSIVAAVAAIGTLVINVVKLPPS